MKLLVQDYETGTVRLEDVPAPAAKRGGIVVRTHASVVSAGTERQTLEFARKSLAGKARSRPDLVRTVVDKVRTDGVLSTYRAAKGRLESWLPLGYSSAGTVVAVGEGVQRFKVGDRVACAGQDHASHGEIVWVPQRFAAPIPAGVTFEDAAFSTLGAIALHGIHQARIEPGDAVGVIGLGLLGSLTVQVLHAYGCRILGVDVSEAAVAQALELGATDGGSPDQKGLLDKAHALSDGHGLDKVLITASTPTNGPLETATELVRRSGRICVVGLVGMNADRRVFYEKEIELTVAKSYGPGRDDAAYPTAHQDLPLQHSRWSVQRNMTEFLRLVALGRIRTDPLVAQQIELDDAPRMYDSLLAGGKGTILIRYDVDKASTEPAAPTTDRRSRQETGEGVPHIGLIGAGNFARAVLLPALAKSHVTHRLTAVASPSGTHAAEAAKRFGFARMSADHDAILGAEDVDTVIVANRHDQHAPLAGRALQLDQNVFVEKPLALDATSLDQVFDALEESKAILQVGHNRRFAPLVQQAKELLEGRETPVQAHYMVNAGALPQDHWTRDPVEGGGRILGEVCHFIDTLQAIIGSRPIHVYASGGTDNIPAEDQVQVLVGFEDGSRTTISYTAFGPKRLAKERLEIIGNGDHIVLDNHRRLQHTRGHRKRSYTERGQDKGHQGQLDAFLAAVTDGTGPAVPYDELYATCAATLAIPRSLESGQRIDVSQRS